MLQSMGSQSKHIYYVYLVQLNILRGPTYMKFAERERKEEEVE